MGKECDTLAYTKEHKTMKIISIVYAATDLKTRETIIEQMSMILVNLEFTVSEDPTNTEIVNLDFDVPFKLKGAVIFFMTQTPTQLEFFLSYH